MPGLPTTVTFQGSAPLCPALLAPTYLHANRTPVESVISLTGTTHKPQRSSPLGWHLGPPRDEGHGDSIHPQWTGK